MTKIDKNIEIMSPRIKRLSDNIIQGNTDDLIKFWDEIKKNGAPLIERIEGDNENFYITLLWKGNEETENVAAFGELFGLDTEETRFSKLLDTDVWYKTWIVNGQSQSVYMLLINEKEGQEWDELDFIVDPLNPVKYVCIDDEKYPNEYYLSFKEESYVALPDYSENKWAIKDENALEGNLKEIKEFKSEILNNERRIWVYTPANYENNGREYGVAVFTDGWEYLNIMNAKNVFDNLIAKGEIPEMCVVFIETHEDREIELTCNEKFNQFLTQEVMKWVTDNYNISTDPMKNLIGGFSLGGLNSAYVGLNNSDVFGNVFCHSSALYWKPEEDQSETGLMIREYREMNKLPLFFYLTIGEYEKQFTDHFNANVEFKNVLEEKKYQIKYNEFMGGHTYMDAKADFANGLIYLLGK